MNSEDQQSNDQEQREPTSGQPESSIPVENNEPTASPIIPSTKPRSKKWIWLVIVVILMIVGWYVFKILNPTSTGPRLSPLSLVPENALYILETDKPYEVWDKISSTNIWEILQTDDDWNEYGNMLIELQSSLSDFDQVLDILANRTVYISGHEYRGDKLDHLFVVDLEGLGVIQTWMTTQDGVTQRKFGESIIFEKADFETKETLYFAFEDNFLLASYTHTLIESSIQAKKESILLRSFDFIDVRRKVMGEGLVRIYINYKALYGYLNAFLGADDIKVIQSRLPLIYSGMYFDVNQDELLLKGNSNFYDSIKTYMSLFPKSGDGGLNVANILPTNTSIYMSLGFESYGQFYRLLDEQLASDPENGEDYSNYTRKTEKFLDIDLEKDLDAWIDDEIALVQVENEGKFEPVLIINAKSAESAQNGMNHLSTQIKRKTPVRFKGVVYKDHTINFLAVKGFFNLILGKLFKHFDRPYYTVIDQYVVFANQPQVLRMMIDNKIAGNTLADVEAYQNFIERIEEEHCGFIYIQPGMLHRGASGLIDDESVGFLNSKSNLLRHFPQLALKISPDRNMFETKILLSIDKIDQPPVDGNIYLDQSDTLDYDSLWKIDPGDQIVITEIEIEDLAAKKQSEEFEEGQPKYEVEIKNGLKHGNYFEYHPTGELKIKGKYKNDLKEGTWKYYDIDGKMLKREKYKKDVLQE